MIKLYIDLILIKYKGTTISNEGLLNGFNIAIHDNTFKVLVHKIWTQFGYEYKYIFLFFGNLNLKVEKYNFDSFTCCLLK